MTKSFKRGQAAMEYLMTYGWAILIVLAVMAVLVYLVRPQKIETCNIGLPFQCDPTFASVTTGGNLTVRLSNTGSTGFTVTGTQCAGKTGSGSFLAAGGTTDVSFDCSNSTALNKGDTFEETVTMTYYPASSPEFTKSIQAQVVVRYKK